MQRLTELENGLRIVTREMPSVETVAVGLYTDVGSRDERPGENGLAHLYEHMVFKGAGGRGAREIAEHIEGVGGDLNAMTGREGTVFTARLLAGDLPLGLSLIADMILRPHFDAAELEREKQVVLQELAEVRETPGDLVFEHLQHAAYPDQPLGRSILGDEKSLSGLSGADLAGWRDTHYRPANMLVVAAGKLAHDDVVAAAETEFGGMPGVKAPAPLTASFSGGTFASAGNGEQAHLAFGWEGPAVTDPAHYAARLFGEAVGGGMSSRLFQELREERGLAYTVWANHVPYADTGLFSVYAATPRSEAEAALALMEAVLADASKHLGQTELDRARTLAKAGLLMSLESCEGQAGYIARQVLVHGRLVEPAEVVAAIDTITLDEVRAAGAGMLAGPKAAATIGMSACS